MTDALVEAIRVALVKHTLDEVDTESIHVALQAIEAAGYRVVPVEGS